MEDIFAFKVALRRDVVELTEGCRVLFAEQSFHFGGFPDEKLAFHAFAIGILRGIEAAVFCVIHLPQHVVKRLRCDVAIERLLRRLERLKIGDDELRVIVKHLLEMWDEPASIGGIAVETAAHLVIHTTPRHFFQREFNHL